MQYTVDIAYIASTRCHCPPNDSTFQSWSAISERRKLLRNPCLTGDEVVANHDSRAWLTDENSLFVATSDGAVAASTIGSASGSVLDEPVREDVVVTLAVRVNHQQEEGEADLGSNVKDTVGDDLGIDRDLVGTLSKTEDDRVSGPEGGSHDREEVEKTSGLSGSERGSFGATGEEDPEDADEERARNTELGPSGDFTIVPSSRGFTGEETSDDHADVEEDDEDAVSRGKTGEEGERDEEQRSGEEPVDVSSVEDLSEDVVLLGSLAVVVSGDVRDTLAGSHSEVRDHGDTENSSREPVEKPGLLLNSESEEDGQGKANGEKTKDDPEGHGTGASKVDEIHLDVGDGCPGERVRVMRVVRVASASWRTD